jgi:hypothetical protein
VWHAATAIGVTIASSGHLGSRARAIEQAQEAERAHRRAGQVIYWRRLDRRNAPFLVNEIGKKGDYYNVS